MTAQARAAEAPSSGVAFVTFSEPEEARRAIAGLNDHTDPKMVLQGNRLHAKRAPGRVPGLSPVSLSA